MRQWDLISPMANCDRSCGGSAAFMGFQQAWAGQRTVDARLHTMPRLTAELWVQAYIHRLRLADIPAFVVSRGDATAGAVIVKQNQLDGTSKAFQRSVDILTGGRIWVVLAEGADEEVDAAIALQRDFDPDLWVIEVEDRKGRHLLDEPGLDA